jgi:hypothetical protein
MSYGPGIRIIYPRMAVKFMRDKLKEALGLYEGAEDKDGSDDLSPVSSADGSVDIGSDV